MIKCGDIGRASNKTFIKGLLAFIKGSFSGNRLKPLYQEEQWSKNVKARHLPETASNRFIKKSSGAKMQKSDIKNYA